jgi:hypothetical protein
LLASVLLRLLAWLDGHDVLPVGMLPVARQNIWTQRDYAKAVAARISDQMVDERGCDPGSSQCIGRAGVVRAD